MFLAGFGLAAAMMGLIFIVEKQMGWIQPHGLRTDIPASNLLALGLGGFVHYFVTSTVEESATRGYLLQNLGEKFPVWIALLATGAVFGLSHWGVDGFGLPFVISAIVGSFLLGGMRTMTGSLWMGIGWHWSWDWLQTYLGLAPAYNVINLERRGPSFWVGTGVAIEAGTLNLLVLLLGFGALIAVAKMAGRSLGFRRRLHSDDGAVNLASI